MTGKRIWTLEKCKESAQSFKTRGAWKKGDACAYQAAVKSKWINECCSHMEKVLEEWTLAKCMASAKRYITKREWEVCDRKAYQAAKRKKDKGWLEACFEHMTPRIILWSLDMCHRSAKRYQTKTEWRRNDPKAYDAAIRHKKHGWFSVCCGHMDDNSNKWTLELCLASARRYSTRNDWSKGEQNAYTAALRNKTKGWFARCVTHMEPSPRNWILEECLESARRYDTREAWRKSDRKAHSAAHTRKEDGWFEQCVAHMKPAQRQWNLEKCLESARRYDTQAAWNKGDRKAHSAAYYRKDEGWFEECVAHMMPAQRQWTLEECLESAGRYDTRAAWQKANRNAYSAAYSRKEEGWFEQCVAHMESAITRWTLDLCLTSAKKYKAILEWRSGDRDAYYAALRHKDKGWFDKCTAHLKYAYARHTEESSMSSALKYSSREEWKNSDLAAFNYAVQNGMMKKCRKHMDDIHRANILKECRLSALRYQTRVEWINGDKRTYKFAIYYGFLDECTQHMTSFRRDHTLESCMASAKRYTTKMDWHNEDYLAYKAAQKNKGGWFEKCTAHMDVVNTVWTLELCMKSVLNFSTIGEWRREDPKAYSAALSNGWHDNVYQHFNSRLDATTFEECTQDAANFDDWYEWAKPDNLFYLAAKFNGWASTCKDIIMGNGMKEWFRKANLERAN